MKLFLNLSLLLLTAIAAAAQIPFNARVTALGMTAGDSPTFFAGTPTGFFRSTDERRTWTPVRLESYRGAPAGVTAIAFDATAPGVVYAAGPTPGRTVFRSDDNGASWAKKTAGLPQGASLERLFVSRGVAGRVYALMRDGERRDVYRSDDRGESWRLHAELPADARLLAIVPLNANVWFYAAERAVFRSNDEGETWQSAGAFPLQSVGGPEAVQNRVTDLRVDPQSQLGLVMTTDGPVFGGDAFDNGVFVSPNGGATWERRATGGFTALHLGEVFLAWRTATGAVWASHDRGATFEGPFAVSGAGPAPGFLVDRRDPARLYAGDFASADGGRTWRPTDATVRPALGALKESLELIGSTHSARPTVNAVALEAIGSRSWAFDFTLDAPVPWLEVRPDPGPTPVSLVVRATPTGLPVGVEETTIVVNAPEAFNQRLEIPVRLEVTDGPAAPPSPRIETFAGNGRFGSDGDGGPATQASLRGVGGLAVDAEGGLLVSATLDDRLRRVAPDGLIEAFADGLSAPEGLAAGPDGAVYVADRGARVVRRIAPDGSMAVAAGSGSDGLGTAQGLALQLPLDPYAVATAPDGALFVSGDGVYRIDPNGRTYLRWSDDSAKALAVGPDGTVYASRGHRVEIQRRGSALPFAGGETAGFIGDYGPAEDALLSDPNGLAVDAEGRVYIADTGNDAVRVVEAGMIRTLAGAGAPGFAGDGGPAAFARLNSPRALATAADGELYVADTQNRRIRVVRSMAMTPPPELTAEGVVSAASYRGGPVAPGQIVSLFGERLAPASAQASQTPLPTALAGARVELVDSGGETHFLGQFFVSGGQINAFIPEEAALGPATLRVRRADGYGSDAVSRAVPIEIADVAPGLFSADSSGTGTAAAAAVRIAADGSQTPVEVIDGGAPVPVDLGPAGEQVVLLLFGTGIRGAETISATVGGVAAQVVGADEQGEFVGLDQVNVLVPRALAGSGEVEIVLTVDRIETNRVTVVIE